MQYTVIAAKPKNIHRLEDGEIILADTGADQYRRYVTWSRYNYNNNHVCYAGHYFKDIEKAYEDWSNR